MVQKLNVGRVLETSFRLLGRRADLFLPLALLPWLAMIPLQMKILSIQAAFQERVASSRSAPNGSDFAEFFGWTLGGVLATMLLTFLVSAASVHGVVMILRGRPVAVGDCLRTGLRRLLPVLGVAFLVGLGSAFGMIFCIVPGLILASMWYVAVVVTVAEGAPVGKSISRSAWLTHGQRMNVFLLLFLIGMISGVAGGIVGGAGAVFLPLIGQAILITVVSAVGSALGAIVQGVTYYELRVLKEGLSLEDLGQVFE